MESRGPGVAPGQLELIQRFANSVAVDARPDRLRDAASTARWLSQAGLRAETTPVPEADRTRLIRLRDLVRAILPDGSDAAPSAEVLRKFNDLAADAHLVVQLGPEGPAVTPAGEGMDRTIGQLIAVIYEATHEGTWPRLKLCPASDCRMAFYDRSKNHSATWCSMAGCGNRAKVRAYQQRQKSAVKSS